MTKAFARALRIGLVVLLLAGFFTAAQPVQAGTAFFVNTTVDQNGGDPECSLREAVIAANTNQPFGGCPAGSGGTDTIFLPGSEDPYSLSIGTLGENENEGRTGDLDILGSLSIFGAGETSTIVHGNSTDRVFDIRFANGVSISNMTITGGSAIEGGAVLVNQSVVDLYNVRVDRNGASQNGGAFAISANSTVSIYNSEITANTAARGGAVYNVGLLTLTNALIEGNRNTFSDPTGSTGVITITTASSSLNRIENTTIANNIVPSASLPAGVWVGGTARVLIRNTTIADNTGTGLEVRSGGIVNLSHTIIARQQGNECNILSSGYKSLGHNLASDNTCGLGAAGDKPNIADGALSMALSPEYHGGKTRTYALNENSSAVDAGGAVDMANPAACHPVDQRYYFRPGDGLPGGPVVCDIGAFEREGTQPTSHIYVPVVIR